jgi:hypothetical protein
VEAIKNRHFPVDKGGVASGAWRTLVIHQFEMVNPRDGMTPARRAELDEIIRANYDGLIRDEGSWRYAAARLAAAASTLEDVSIPLHDAYIQAARDGTIDHQPDIEHGHSHSMALSAISSMLRAMCIECMLKRVIAAMGEVPPSHHKFRNLIDRSKVFEPSELRHSTRPQKRIAELSKFGDWNMNVLLSFFEEQSMLIEAPRYPSPKPDCGYIGSWGSTDLTLFDYVIQRIRQRLVALGVDHPGIFIESD